MSKNLISLEVIQTGFRDHDCDVRQAAMEACKEKGIPIPVTRTIEPPELVYKRCVADVIIVAEIPKDANVRGAFGRKCRADKAIIKEVIGDFCGEPVGISLYDKTTTYYAGDVVEIEILITVMKNVPLVSTSSVPEKKQRTISKSNINTP